MNIVLFEPEELINSVVELTDRRADHIVKILKSKVGETLKIGVINGKIGVGEIVYIDKLRPYRVTIQVNFPEIKTVSEPTIDIVLALPRPIMLKRIFTQIAALGVGSVYIINANRVEKSFWSASLLKEKKYRRRLLDGLEQSVDTIIPKVEIFRYYKPFMDDFLPGIVSNYSNLLIAHPNGEKNMFESVKKGEGRSLLAIGPEGGWVDFEIEKFEDNGFSVVTMGNRILKVDTAVVALHSKLTTIIEGYLEK